MGHPKKQRRKFETPQKPYDKERIQREKKLLREFGLRRKKELWRFESLLRIFRQRARNLQAKPDEKTEKILFEKLNKIGIPVKSLDDVLNIQIDIILARRLQTVLYKKGIASTPKQARQLIVHGHVRINNKRMTWPSYIVKKDEDKHISVKPIQVNVQVKGEQQ